MPAENNGAPSNGAPSGSAAPVARDGTENAPGSAKSAAAAPAETEKLTPAQLKAKAKAEKAARRAQAKEAKAAAQAASPAGDKGAAADAKGAKGKGKQDGQQPQGKGGHLQVRRPSVSGGRRPSSSTIEKDARSAIPECFSHVPMAKRIPTSQTHKDVHPAVLAVGQQMATFALNDSISRLKATLLAFRKVSGQVQLLERKRAYTHRTCLSHQQWPGYRVVRDAKG